MYTHVTDAAPGRRSTERLVLVMSRADEVYRPALAGTKIPILTLDSKWHQLFSQARPDKRLKRLEEKLNDLLKKQGKANTDMKDIRRLKKRLMQEILDNAQDACEGNDERAWRRAEENKRLITECNEKLRECEDELHEVPREIEQVNTELMLATMELCYSRLKENEKEIDEIATWVAQVREELKERLIRKQEMEQTNQELYSYMHDIFGANVIDIFDMKYQQKSAGDEKKK